MRVSESLQNSLKQKKYILKHNSTPLATTRKRVSKSYQSRSWKTESPTCRCSAKDDKGDDKGTVQVSRVTLA